VKTINNESGMSLIELMVTMSVMAIVALSFSAYMYNSRKQQRNLEENMSVLQLNNLINTTAMDAQSIYNSATQSQVVPASTPPGNPVPTGQSI
jgi:prepilin-type N-terminal cleavage/methylation domain-containing protein